MARGQRLTEILKQGQYAPLPFSKQILIIYAGTQGLLDDMPVDQLRDFEKGLYDYVDTSSPAIFKAIEEKKSSRRRAARADDEDHQGVQGTLRQRASGGAAPAGVGLGVMSGGARLQALPKS